MFEMIVDEDVMNKAISEMVDRRKAISSMKIHCPECGTNQVQLVVWIHRLCDMKCRHCKQKFVVDVGM